MKNRRSWVIVILTFSLAAILAGSYALWREEFMVGAFALALSIFFAQDLRNLFARDVFRAARRDAYASSGVRPQAGAEGGVASVGAPRDAYFKRAFADSPVINPATGLPLIVGGIGHGVDVGGNVYGTSSSSFGAEGVGSFVELEVGTQNDSFGCDFGRDACTSLD